MRGERRERWRFSTETAGPAVRKRAVACCGPAAKGEQWALEISWNAACPLVKNPYALWIPLVIKGANGKSSSLNGHVNGKIMLMGKLTHLISGGYITNSEESPGRACDPSTTSWEGMFIAWISGYARCHRKTRNECSIEAHFGIGTVSPSLTQSQWARLTFRIEHTYKWPTLPSYEMTLDKVHLKFH